jgi:hypothetical protein
MIVMITTSPPGSPSTIPSPSLPEMPVTIDGQGRVRTSREQRRVILAEFERSGVSAAQFAKVSGIKYSTLAGWLQRQRRAKPKGRPRSVRLLEAVVEQARLPVAHSGTALLLQLPGGVQASLSDLKQVPLAAALVRALASPC